jgi:hypothetical protein
MLPARLALNFQCNIFAESALRRFHLGGRRLGWSTSSPKLEGKDRERG